MPNDRINRTSKKEHLEAMTIKEELRGTAGTGQWVGFDLDGTLAHYDRWRGPNHIGAPIPEMIDLIKAYIEANVEVHIFTARACDPIQVPVVERFCERHIGRVLQVTNVKDFGMRLLYDDRAIQIVPNTGRSVKEQLIRAGWVPPEHLT